MNDTTYQAVKCKPELDRYSGKAGIPAGLLLKFRFRPDFLFLPEIKAGIF